MSKFLILTSALALTAALGTSAALAGGKAPTQQAGINSPVVIAGNVHINQNGDGCRNRCVGTQTFNAGFGNGNININGLTNGKHLGWAP